MINAAFKSDNPINIGTTHPSIIAWKTPWTEEPGGLQSKGVAKSQTRLSEWAQKAFRKIWKVTIFMIIDLFAFRIHLLLVYHFWVSEWSRSVDLQPGMQWVCNWYPRNEWKNSGDTDGYQDMLPFVYWLICHEHVQIISPLGAHTLVQALWPRHFLWPPQLAKGLKHPLEQRLANPALWAKSCPLPDFFKVLFFTWKNNFF